LLASSIARRMPLFVGAPLGASPPDIGRSTPILTVVMPAALTGCIPPVPGVIRTSPRTARALNSAIALRMLSLSFHTTLRRVKRSRVRGRAGPGTPAALLPAASYVLGGRNGSLCREPLGHPAGAC